MSRTLTKAELTARLLSLEEQMIALAERDGIRLNSNESKITTVDTTTNARVDVVSDEIETNTGSISDLEDAILEISEILLSKED